MRELILLEPDSVDGATQLLAEHGDEARVMGGGTAVVLMYNQRLIEPHYLVSLAKVPGLDYIRQSGGGELEIGAMTSHRDVERSNLVRQACPLLADVFHQVANVRVRNQATVGGVVAEADYASDPPTALVALDATVHVASSGTSRDLPMRGFVRDFFETILDAGEIVTGVTVPPLPAGGRTAYIKYKSRSSEDRACVNVAVVASIKEGRCEGLRVVVGTVAETPQEVPAAAELAFGEPLHASVIAAIAERYAKEIEPISDIRGTAWYRRRVIQVVVRRALEQIASGVAA